MKSPSKMKRTEKAENVERWFLQSGRASGGPWTAVAGVDARGEGINVFDGHVTCQAVAQSQTVAYRSLMDLLFRGYSARWRHSGGENSGRPPLI